MPPTAPHTLETTRWGADFFPSYQEDRIGMLIAINGQTWDQYLVVDPPLSFAQQNEGKQRKRRTSLALLSTVPMEDRCWNLGWELLSVLSYFPTIKADGAREARWCAAVGRQAARWWSTVGCWGWLLWGQTSR